MPLLCYSIFIIRSTVRCVPSCFAPRIRIKVRPTCIFRCRARDYILRSVWMAFTSWLNNPMETIFSVFESREAIHGDKRLVRSFAGSAGSDVKVAKGNPKLDRSLYILQKDKTLESKKEAHATTFCIFHIPGALNEHFRHLRLICHVHAHQVTVTHRNSYYLLTHYFMTHRNSELSIILHSIWRVLCLTEAHSLAHSRPVDFAHGCPTIHVSHRNVLHAMIDANEMKCNSKNLHKLSCAFLISE